MSIRSVSPGAAPVVRSAPTAPSTPAAATPSSTPAGHVQGSSYTASSSQAATGTISESANTSKAIEILGKTEGSDAATLKKLLGYASMTRDEVQEGFKALENIELSPADRKVVEQSLAYGNALANCMAFSKLMMENIMEDLKKTLKL